LVTSRPRENGLLDLSKGERGFYERNTLRDQGNLHAGSVEHTAYGITDEGS